MLILIMSVALTAIGAGRELHVPTDYPTLEAAATAVSSPEDVIVVAPGVYAPPAWSDGCWLTNPPTCDPFYFDFVYCDGATIRGSTGDPNDVVLLDYSIIDAKLEHLSLQNGPGFGGPACDYIEAFDCNLFEVVVTATPCSFDSCALSGVEWFEATLTDCTVDDPGLSGPTSAIRTSFVASNILAADFLIDCVFDQSTVTMVWWWDLQHMLVQRCLFKNAPGIALTTTSLYGGTGCSVSHCTFVNNSGGDFRAWCGGDIAGSSSATNSICTSVAPPPDQGLADCVSMCRVLQAQGNVDEQGFVIPGSAAWGSGFWPDGESASGTCPFNIGWDQTGTPEDCNFNRGDLNGDGVVDGVDLGQLLTAWGSTDVIGDADCEVGVGPGDLGILLSSWTG